MPPLSNAAFAILSLVCEQPRHGYEIESVIVARGMRDWTDLGFSSIYYLLNKLRSQGLVTAKAGPGDGGPIRKVFAATQLGRDACRDAAIAALAVPSPPRSALQLGLANVPALSPDEVEEALARRRAALQESRAALLARRDSQGPMPPFVLAMFSHGLAGIDAEIAWLDTSPLTPGRTSP